MAPANSKSTIGIELLVPLLFGTIPVLNGLFGDALRKKTNAESVSNGAGASVDRKAERGQGRPKGDAHIEVGMRNRITPYEHIPLKSNQHIRVIKLYPSKREQAALRCSILQIGLDCVSGANIEAISYSWGPNVPPENDLYCKDAKNESSSFSVFKISTSLHSALVRFRDKTESRLIWADAVCIDQDNCPEKSSQVRHIANIYAKASRTLIWLGKGNSSDEKCIEFFKELNAILPASATGEKTIRNAIKQTFGTEAYEPLARFFKSMSRFTRRWIIQEVVKSAEAFIYCGTSSISWRTFAAGVESLNRYSPRDMLVSGIDVDILTTIGYINTLWECRSPITYGILGLLTSFHLSECIDPRDRIYALLNLTDAKNYITPDYSKTTEGIYKGFAFNLPRDDYLHLLHCSPAFQPEGGNAGRGWISWVPYWSQKMAFNPLFSARDFKAGGVLAPEITINRRRMELTISGKVLNNLKHDHIVITSINDPVPNPKELETVHNWIETWIPQFGHYKPHWSDFAITLVADLNSGMYKQSPAGNLKQRYEGVQQRQTKEDQELAFLEISQYTRKMKDFVSPRRETRLRDKVEYSPRARKYAKQLYTTMRGRCFFQFVKGRDIYIGIGPARMEEGDTIAIFNGDQTPTILRPDKETDRYNLIGDCYIHGLMHGEALTLRLREETFVLA